MTDKRTQAIIRTVNTKSRPLQSGQCVSFIYFWKRMPRLESPWAAMPTPMAAAGIFCAQD